MEKAAQFKERPEVENMGITDAVSNMQPNREIWPSADDRSRPANTNPNAAWSTGIRFGSIGNGWAVERLSR